MKSFSVNRNSWHGRLAFFYGSHLTDYDGTTDLCSYTNSIIRGLGIVFLIILSVGSILSALVECLLAFAMLGTVFEASILALLILFALTCVGLAIILGISLVKLVDWIRIRKQRRVLQLDKEPGIISLAYSSLKDKMCVQIKFDD